MSIVPIVQLNKHELFRKDTILRNPSKEVSDFGPAFQKIVDDLIDTMNSYSIAVGLAGPQVGVDLRVAVINVSKSTSEPEIVIVNPRVISSAGKKDKKKESCMSVPHYRGEVERRERILVECQDRLGAPQTIEAKGFLARVLFHEIDHLSGVLYLDRMSDPKSLEPVDFFKTASQNDQ